MFSPRHFVLGLAALCCVSSLALAQERGDTGLVVEAPGSVGLIWHVTDRLAVSPAVSFSHRAVTAEPQVIDDIESSASTVAFDISARFYLATWDKLQAYVSPVFNTAIHSADTDLGDESSFGVAGLFGLQYALSDRFGVFGATGVSYQRSTLENTLGGPLFPSIKTTVSSIGSESRVGIIFYF